MKKIITRQEQQYINELLKKRKEREMKKLFEARQKQISNRQQQIELEKQAMWESYDHI